GHIRHPFSPHGVRVPACRTLRAALVEHRAHLRGVLRAVRRATEPAYDIQELSHLLVASKQEDARRCRTGRPRVSRYVVNLYRTPKGRRSTSHKHLPIESTGC